MTTKSDSSSDHTVVVLGGCLAIGVVLAVLAFLFLGFTIWTALLAGLLLVCPIVIGWGWFTTRRQPRLPASDKSS